MSLIKIAGLIVFIVALLLVMPLLTIWSLNTLFPALAIPYAFETWAAVVLLGAAMRTKVTTKS